MQYCSFPKSFICFPEPSKYIRNGENSKRFDRFIEFMHLETFWLNIYELGINLVSVQNYDINLIKLFSNSGEKPLYFEYIVFFK